MLSLILLIVAIFIIYLLLYKSRKNVHLPGPVNLPIIGALHLLDPNYPFVTFLKFAEKYGKIFHFKMGPIETVVVSDPILLKKILLKNGSIDRPPFYVMERFINNEGVVFSNGDVSKGQRKFLLKILKSVGATKNSPQRQNLLDKFQSSIHDLIEEISQKKVIIPAQTFSIAIASSLYHTLTGDVSTVSNKDWERFFNDIDQVNENLSTAGFLNFFPIFRFLPNYSKIISKLDKVFHNLNGFQKTLIDKRRENYKNPEIPNFFIDALLEENQNNRKVFTESQMIKFHQDVYAAGLETTHTTISWIIYLLTKHKIVQNKARQEIHELIGDRPIEIDDFEKLHYTQAVISECGRFRTTVPLGLPHYTNEDISVDGLKIEKNTMILGSIVGIHMNRKYWKTPEEFNPNRFLNLDGTYKKHDWYMPFETGLRGCIGEDFARVIVSVFIVEVLRHFELEKFDKVELDFNYGTGLSNTPRKQKIMFKKIM